MILQLNPSYYVEVEDDDIGEAILIYNSKTDKDIDILIWVVKMPDGSIREFENQFIKISGGW